MKNIENKHQKSTEKESGKSKMKTSEIQVILITIGILY